MNKSLFDNTLLGEKVGAKCNMKNKEKRIVPMTQIVAMTTKETIGKLAYDTTLRSQNMNSNAI